MAEEGEDAHAEGGKAYWLLDLTYSPGVFDVIAIVIVGVVDVVELQWCVVFVVSFVLGDYCQGWHDLQKCVEELRGVSENVGE